MSTTTTTEASRLAAALDYAARGWPVFPGHTMTRGGCSCGRADCDSVAKHPRTKNGLDDATTDADTIREWWHRWPAANVLIRTGHESGFFVLDKDPRHGGDESLAALEAEHGPLPATVEAKTGGGGSHFLFAMAGDIRNDNRGKVGRGLDVKGTGGYIVGATSNHKDGPTYQWAPGRGPDHLPIAEAPAWLLAKIQAPAKSTTNGDHRTTTSGDTLGRLVETAQRYAAKVPGAAQGGRNDAAFSLAGHLAAIEAESTGERLTVEQITNVLRGWNQKNSPPLADGELCKAATSGTTNGQPRAPHVVKAPPAPRSALSGHATATTSSNGQAADEEPRTFPVFTPRQLATMDLETEFLIDGVLARQQPGLVAGVFKTLKTSIAADAGLSIATATPFLGTFRVGTAASVLFMSAESGLKKLRDTFQRIATARGIEFADIGPKLLTSPVVPMLGNILDHDALLRTINGAEAEVVFIDPGYRAMAAIGNDAGNVFKVGALLSHVDEIAEATGTTILIVHHCQKHSAANFEPPELRHVSMSGFAEWARQWLLLGPRAAWNPDTGEHRLWLNYGGSEGHAGAWGLDVREGRHGDPGGQVWDTRLVTLEEVRSGATDSKAVAKEQKRVATLEANRRKIVQALAKSKKPETCTTLRELAGLGPAAVKATLADLHDAGEVEPCTVTTGNNNREVTAWKLAGSDPLAALLGA